MPSHISRVKNLLIVSKKVVYQRSISLWEGKEDGQTRTLVFEEEEDEELSEVEGISMGLER